MYMVDVFGPEVPLAKVHALPGEIKDELVQGLLTESLVLRRK